MSGALLVLRAELARLLGSKVAWFGLWLVASVSGLRVVAAQIAAGAKAVERVASGGGAAAADSAAEGTGWAFLVDGWRTGMLLALALLLVQAARAVAGDRESGVLRLAVTRSASRSGAILGRALLGPILTLSMLLAAGLGAYAVCLLYGADFGDLIEDEYMILSGAEIRSELAVALAGVFVAMIAIHGFGLLVSSLSRGAVLALAGSIAVILLWDVFKEDLGDARWFVFASHAPTFADGSSMKEMAGIARGMSDAGHPVAIRNMGLILSPLAWLICVGLACVSIRKRPI